MNNPTMGYSSFKAINQQSYMPGGQVYEGTINMCTGCVGDNIELYNDSSY